MLSPGTPGPELFGKAARTLCALLRVGLALAPVVPELRSPQQQGAGLTIVSQQWFQKSPRGDDCIVEMVLVYRGNCGGIIILL